MLGALLVSLGIISLSLQRGHMSRKGTIWALVTGSTMAALTVIGGNDLPARLSRYPLI